jgi:hypothetical protein
MEVVRMFLPNGGFSLKYTPLQPTRPYSSYPTECAKTAYWTLGTDVHVSKEHTASIFWAEKDAMRVQISCLAEDGSGMFIRNVRHFPKYMLLQPRKSPPLRTSYAGVCATTCNGYVGINAAVSKQLSFLTRCDEVTT